MGSSGGGASGAVSWPAYLESVHTLLLDDAGADTPTASIVAAFNVAYGASPFIGTVAYDPDIELATTYSRITAAISFIDLLEANGDYERAYSTAAGTIVEDDSFLDAVVLDEGEIAADITATGLILEDELNDRTIPNFRSGFLNIGAVNSSSFVIGEALIRAYKGRDLAKYVTELRVAKSTRQDDINARHRLQYREIQARHKINRREQIRNGTTQIISSFLKEGEFLLSIAGTTIEAKRLHIIAKKEEIAEQADFDEKNALWDLSLFQSVANLLAGPSGGTVNNERRPSKATSALAGAASGAATGAAIGSAFGGPGYGTAIGAVVGLGIGLSQ